MRYVICWSVFRPTFCLLHSYWSTPSLSPLSKRNVNSHHHICILLSFNEYGEVDKVIHVGGVRIVLQTIIKTGRS